MRSERRGIGGHARGWATLLVALMGMVGGGCASGRGGAPRPSAEVVLRNLSGQTVWVYIETNQYGQLLGSAPALSRSRLRIPDDLSRPGSKVKLTVARGVHLPGRTEIVTEVTLPIEDVRRMEWTLVGSTLNESLLRGVPLAGGRARP